MKKSFTLLIATLTLLALMTRSLTGLGQTTYTFTSTAWADESNSWSSDKNGSATGDDRGIAVQKAESGAGATTKNSVSNITSITINAARSGKGVGSIDVYVGNENVLTQSSFNTTSTDYTVNFNSAKSGKVSFVVTCTTSTIYVKSVTITNSSGPATFSVTYNAGSGTGDPVVDNNSGSGYTSGTTYTVKANTGDGCPNFTKTGYSFDAWYDNAGLTGTAYGPGDGQAHTFSITGNTTLYAKWNVNQYNVAVSEVANVTLTATYGTPTSTITEGISANLDYGTAVTLNATGLGDGQTFVWKITKTTGGDDVTATVLSGTTLTVPDYNVTISGSIVQKYTVTYECDNGEGDCPDQVTNIVAGTSITLADAPEKDDYVFMGWNDGTSTYAAGASYKVNATVTLTAQWRAGATCRVNFGSSSGYFNLSSASSFDDALGNTWTASPSWASSAAYNAQTNYVQVGTSSGYLNSITFSTTLPEDVIIIAFSAKIGGYSGTAGTIDLQVDGSSIGSASLNNGSDITATNSSTAVGTELTVSVGNKVDRIKCYYIEYTYVEIGSDPYINTASFININSEDTNNELAFEILNPAVGKLLSASSTTEWITSVSVDSENNKVIFTTTENASTTDNRSGSITLSYEGADNKTVTVNQSKVDYAAMPFEYTGNASSDELGFTKSGIGTYASQPKIKFDGTGDYLIIKFHEAPASVSYDVKINGTWGATSVFDIMTSNDGKTWTTVKSHTTMSSTTATFTCLNLSGKYIKWVYTYQDKGGNVGLGNLKANTSYEVYGTAIVASLEPTSSKKCTIYNGGVLTVTGTLENGTAANLTINDGGQLITTTGASVSATVKKNVTTWSASPVAGWLAISSPVDGFNFTTGGNFVPATGNYTMYAYDEKNCMWINSQDENDNFNTLVKGRGYLYRKTNNTAVEIAGTLVTSNFDYSLSYSGEVSTKGFNLIGNPYTHNIYKGTGTAIPNTYLKNGFYYLTSAGGFTLGTDNDDPIAPGQAVLVQATAANNLAFTNTPSDGSAKANHDKIIFKVANSQYEDVTCAMFDKGEGINKISHRNEDIPMIYIPQNGKNYALAMFSDFTEAFELSFKAATTGVYTLSYTTKGEFNYLHVIDRLTGADIDMLLEGEYKFIGTPSDTKNRFIVRLAYMPDYSGGDNDIFAFQNGSDIYVSGQGELQIFDVTGRFVMSERINGATSISADALSKGVYVLRIVGSEIKTQKIVVR